jgi:hypothetical protein
MKQSSYCCPPLGMYVLRLSKSNKGKASVPSLNVSLTAGVGGALVDSILC